MVSQEDLLCGCPSDMHEPSCYLARDFNGDRDWWRELRLQAVRFPYPCPKGHVMGQVFHPRYHSCMTCWAEVTPGVLVRKPRDPRVVSVYDQADGTTVEALTLKPGEEYVPAKGASILFRGTWKEVSQEGEKYRHSGGFSIDFSGRVYA